MDLSGTFYISYSIGLVFTLTLKFFNCYIGQIHNEVQTQRWCVSSKVYR